MDEKIIQNKVVICMGSSCFSRGNNRNLEVIKKFATESKGKLEIEITGSLCEDKCSKGPNIKINEKLYNNIDPNSLIELLNRLPD